MTTSMPLKRRASSRSCPPTKSIVAPSSDRSTEKRPSALSKVGFGVAELVRVRDSRRNLVVFRSLTTSATPLSSVDEALDQLGPITTPDLAAANGRRVDADVPLIILHGRAEHRRVFWQAVLAERGHHAARAGPVDPQGRAANRERPAGPSVF